MNDKNKEEEFQLVGINPKYREICRPDREEQVQILLKSMNATFCRLG